MTGERVGRRWRQRRRRRDPAVRFGHHAQNDRWIAEAAFVDVRGGFFVEAGACAGASGSATLALERDLGWTGICVEPVDSYYKTLVARRTCATDSRCLSDITGSIVEFLSYPDDRARSGIRHLNKNEPAVRTSDTVRRRTRGAWASSSTAREVSAKETVTLADLLDWHAAPDVVHYLCLDVEGAERTILGSFNFDGPRKILAISVEGSSCDDVLVDAGYRRVDNPFAPEPIDHYFLHPTLGTLPGS
jgi:hypothetical protein